MLAGAAPTPEVDERRLSADLVTAAARLRETETALTASLQQVADLTAHQRTARDALDARAAAMAPLLPLAERLAMFPAETLLAVPAPPEQSIRGLALLHGLMRTVELQSAALRAELNHLETAQRALDAALTKLRTVELAQRQQSAAIERQLADARTLRATIDDAGADATRREAAEATRAETLAGALETMATARARTQALLQQDAERAERQRHETALAITRQRQAQTGAQAGPGMRQGAAAILPVAGPLVRHWGEPTETGPAHGLAFRAPPRGLVVSPCAGRVAFAGPFRSYGVVVILDCGGGYHFVLAGLDRLEAEAGEKVQPGEPVGIMPDWQATASSPRPALYVELRYDGRPVDPTPFLRPTS